MKHHKLTSLICSSLVSISGTSLLAQSSQEQVSQPAPSTSTRQSTPATSSTQGLSGASASDLHSRALATTPIPSSQVTAMPNSDRSVRASQIINNSVRSPEGKTLGFIRDLIVDPQTGAIQFAIMALSSAGAASDTSTSGRETVPFSRSSPIGTPAEVTAAATGKLVPVPWQLFSKGQQAALNSSLPGVGLSSMTGPNLVLNLDESRLRTAPSFDATNWTEMQGGNLAQRAYSYFGTDQTAVGTSGSSLSGQGSSSSTSDTTRQNLNPNPASPQSPQHDTSGSQIPDQK